MPLATSTEGVSWSVNTPAGKVTLIGSNCSEYQVAVIKRHCLIGGRRHGEGWGGSGTRSLKWLAAGGVVHVV